jgi:hypothetical protein
MLNPACDPDSVPNGSKKFFQPASIIGMESSTPKTAPLAGADLPGGRYDSFRSVFPAKG